MTPAASQQMLAALIRGRELPVLSAADWLLLLHPALMILFVYPVVGATIRLGILVREKRLDLNPIAATVPGEHVDHGRWVTTGTVVAVVLAVVALRVQDGAVAATPPTVALMVGALGGCLALWRLRRPAARAAAALLSWGALALLVAPPPLLWAGGGPRERVWGNHGSSGVLLTGLLLFAMAAAPEIRASPPWRRLHTAAAVLTALLLAVQAISGSRDLLTLR
ncbi:MAG: DUF4079 domain-containing protein [Cyanobacteriota bacterium]|nr:DUF4079 domain-containing protein [Cyanobacteriota bacterium]